MTSAPSSGLTSPDPVTWVVCLCAQWCGLCRDYRAVVAGMAPLYPAMRFAWLDVEDQADLVGDVDVETFPTVMLSKAREALFLGPVLPQIGVLQRMVDSALAQAAPAALKDESAQALLARLLGAKGVELVF